MQYSWGANGPLVAKAGTTERVLVTDAHADVVGSTTVGTAAVAGTHTYTPWGETRTDTAGFSRTIELGFQGDPTATETGLVDMGIRHYLPSVGRFSTRDVLFGDASNPVSLNRYVYGGANPVTMSDPTGMVWTTTHESVVPVGIAIVGVMALGCAVYCGVSGNPRVSGRLARRSEHGRDRRTDRGSRP